jgi:hypothetical protein
MPLRVLVPTLSSVPYSKASSGSGGESASSGQWPSALSKFVLIQYSNNNKVSRQNQAALQSSVFAGQASVCNRHTNIVPPSSGQFSVLFNHRLLLLNYILNLFSCR